MEQVANPLLASSVGRSNLLTNGGLEWWQRGTASVAITSGSIYLADRWYAQILGSGAGTYAQDTTNVDVGSNAAAAINVTATSTAPLTNGVLFAQKLEDVKQLRGKPLSVKYRIKASVVGSTVQPYYSDGANNTPVGSPVSIGTTYQDLAYTFTTGATTGGLYTFLCFTSVATFYIDNVMMVVGTQACDYVPMHPADDYARCLRYYELLGPVPNYPQIKGCATGANVNIGANLAFAAKKAVTPTNTIAGTFTFVNTNAPISMYSGGVHGVFVQAVSAAAGEATYYSNGSGYFIAEANP